MQPVYFDSALVRPLPRELLGSICSQCDKPQASWALTAVSKAGESTPFVCSLCLLYKSRWAETAKERVASLVGEVERVLGRSFPKNEQGCLTGSSDADRIMFAIVLENMQSKALAKRSK